METFCTDKNTASNKYHRWHKSNTNHGGLGVCTTTTTTAQRHESVSVSLTCDVHFRCLMLLSDMLDFGLLTSPRRPPKVKKTSCCNVVLSKTCYWLKTAPSLSWLVRDSLLYLIVLIRKRHVSAGVSALLAAVPLLATITGLALSSRGNQWRRCFTSFQGNYFTNLEKKKSCWY